MKKVEEYLATWFLLGFYYNKMIAQQLCQRHSVKLFVIMSLSVFFFISRPQVVRAQDYPNKPIIITIGFTPGGIGGATLQLFAEVAKKYLPKPQPILI